MARTMISVLLSMVPIATNSAALRLRTGSRTCGGMSCWNLRREAAAFEAGALEATMSSVAACLQEAKDLLHRAMEAPHIETEAESHRTADPAKRAQAEEVPGAKAGEARSPEVPAAQVAGGPTTFAKVGGCGFFWREEGDAKRWAKEKQASVDAALKKRNFTAAMVGEKILLEGLLSHMKTAVMRLDLQQKRDQVRLEDPRLQPRPKRDQGRQEDPKVSTLQRNLRLTRGLVQLLETAVGTYQQALLRSRVGPKATEAPSALWSFFPLSGPSALEAAAQMVVR